MIKFSRSAINNDPLQLSIAVSPKGPESVKNIASFLFELCLTICVYYWMRSQQWHSLILWDEFAQLLIVLLEIALQNALSCHIGYVENIIVFIISHWRGLPRDVEFYLHKYWQCINTLCWSSFQPMMSPFWEAKNIEPSTSTGPLRCVSAWYIIWGADIL